MTTLTWAETRDILTEIAEGRPFPLLLGERLIENKALLALRPVAAAALAEVERLSADHAGLIRSLDTVLAEVQAWRGALEGIEAFLHDRGENDEGKQTHDWGRAHKSLAARAVSIIRADIERIPEVTCQILSAGHYRSHWGEDHALAQPAAPATGAPLSEPAGQSARPPVWTARVDRVIKVLLAQGRDELASIVRRGQVCLSSDECASSTACPCVIIACL